MNKMFALGDVLGPRLAALQARAAESLSLTEKVRKAIDEPVRPHLISASWRGETTLVVLVDSGAWACHVRMGESQLREALTAAGEPDFARLWVRVSAPHAAAA